MRKIFKYPIPIAGEFELSLPEGARPLSVQVQDDQPCLWALVDPAKETVQKRFRLAGTGHPIENAETLSFIDTFQLGTAAKVFHVFEEN